MFRRGATTNLVANCHRGVYYTVPMLYLFVILLVVGYSGLYGSFLTCLYGVLTVYDGYCVYRYLVTLLSLFRGTASVLGVRITI